jgi:ADP-ribose pyrophosphatase YjhB (NUDIX family)
MEPIKLQVGVKVLLQNKKGNYLVVKRSSDKYKNVVGLWDIPGGRIDPGTPLIDNLKRELIEETKLLLQGTPKLLIAQDIIRLPERHVVRLTYVAQGEGEPVLDEENTDFKWLSKEEILSLEDLDEFLAEAVKLV